MNDNNGDPTNREGHLQLKIEKLSEFARETYGQRLSEPVSVLGFQWKILAISKTIRGAYDSYYGNYASKQCLAFYLQCSVNSTESAWACAASATFKLLAQKEGKQDHVVNKSDHLFQTIAKDSGFEQFMTFEAMMNPESGWYDEANDSIVLTVDFKADALRGVSYISREHIIQVDGKEVNVNKHHLASYSSYFERFFFGEGYKENNKLELEFPANVGHFKRMMDAMEPQNRPLDDKCIEGVLKLANQFLLVDVEEKCRYFLYKDCKRSAVFRYRLADKYNFATLKQQILDSPKENFFKEGEFFENLREYAKLDEKARMVLDTQLGQLFGPILDDEESDEEE